MTWFLDMLQDWSFVVPLVLWACREIYGVLRRRRRRVRLFGFRRRGVVRLVRDQETAYRGHVLGMVGSLSIARAAQRLRDGLERVGLPSIEIDTDEFDQDWTGNLALVGTLRSGRCLAVSLLSHLNFPAEVGRDFARVCGISVTPQLRLDHGALTVTRHFTVVVRTKNPNDTRHDVLIIASPTAEGVERAVRALDRREVAQQLVRRRCNAAILEIDPEMGSTLVQPLVRPALPAVETT